MVNIIAIIKYYLMLNGILVYFIWVYLFIFILSCTICAVDNNK